VRIVLDLQAGQTIGSRHRGIGRYSMALARAMVEQAGHHEIHIGASQAFADALEDMRGAFPEIASAGRFRVWQPPMPVGEAWPDNRWRMRAAELIREAWLREARPDVIHICSLFEGFSDDAVTSVPDPGACATAVTLYDLIPYVNQERYLSNTPVREWYLRKLEHLRKADLLLAISEYSRREALDTLGLDPERIVTVFPAADARFRRLNIPLVEEQDLRMRLGLKRPFVMYTGGIDYRKNLEGLIEAYALLPQELRQQHCLAIVCRAGAAEREKLLQCARNKGLSDGEVAITGYVSDVDLVALYNLCKLFVFPSLHEGFGLPVLEAMHCGAPVIGSDRSSIPEVLGLRDALFDPASPAVICAKIHAALTDGRFRERLTAHGGQQAHKFSWQDSGRRALEAFQAVHERQRQIFRSRVAVRNGRPRLAYVSPLPPEQSGISEYSADLLPELARHYDIDLVTDLPRISDARVEQNFRRVSVAEFELRAHSYHRILYQIGNSAFHRHMLPLLERHPGTVVLHDFFLSGLMWFIERSDPEGRAFQQSLYRSHGYPALLVLGRKSAESALWLHPCNLRVLERAQGVIVHSEYSMQLARSWFGIDTRDWAKIAHLRSAADPVPRASARKSLGIPADAFLVCSFGIVASTKLNDRLLQAWLTSGLAKDPNCYLVFVGDGQGGDFARSLTETIKAAGSQGRRIRITGHVDRQLYCQYLSGADVGVQLRARSRGETSGAVLDCLAYGLATIVNSHATLAELPGDAVTKLADEFSTAELAQALETLHRDRAHRDNLAQRARQHIERETNPSEIARQYAAAIERFASEHPVSFRKDLLAEIGRLPANPRPSNDDLARVASSIAGHSAPPGPSQLLVDVTMLIQGEEDTDSRRTMQAIVSRLLEEPPAGYRVEPVYRCGSDYRYARGFAIGLLGLQDLGLADTPVAAYADDVFLQFDRSVAMDEPTLQWLLHHRRRGMRVYSFIHAASPSHGSDSIPAEMPASLADPTGRMSRMVDGFICSSRAAAASLMNELQAHQRPRLGPLDISYLEPGSDEAKQITRLICEKRWSTLPQQAALATNEHLPTGSRPGVGA
jgi:glycosyltransferase involved in cell wall biosynthesis